MAGPAALTMMGHRSRKQKELAMRNRLQQLWQDQDGQGLVEYGLILGLVSVVCVAALTSLGGKANATLSTITNQLP